VRVGGGDERCHIINEGAGGNMNIVVQKEVGGRGNVGVVVVTSRLDEAES
jgi:hypothetical protein